MTELDDTDSPPLLAGHGCGARRSGVDHHRGPDPDAEAGGGPASRPSVHPCLIG